MDQMPVVGGSSPWGVIQFVTVKVPGHVVAVSTAGHGGLWASKEWRAKMPAALLTPSTFYKTGSPWFEEDVECLRVMAGNPELFPTISPEEIRKALSSYHPECFQGERMKQDQNVVVCSCGCGATLPDDGRDEAGKLLPRRLGVR